jgi:protein SCO1/2
VIAVFLSLLAASPPGAVDIMERLGHRVPPEIELIGPGGAHTRIGSLFGARPLVLTLGYYRCPALCSLVLGAVAKAAAGLDWRIGREYEVVSVSIDAFEAPEVAAEQRRGFVQAAGVTVPDAWPFFTASDRSIDALAEAVGFQFHRVDGQRQFAHAAAIVVLTADGRVSRYLYGVSYDPRQLQIALGEAAGGRVGSSWQRFLLRCYRWDAATHRYQLVVTRYFRVGGLVLLLLVGGLLVRLWRRELRGRR